jgi:hypothetical protein
LSKYSIKTGLQFVGISRKLVSNFVFLADCDWSMEQLMQKAIAKLISTPGSHYQRQHDSSFIGPRQTNFARRRALSYLAKSWSHQPQTIVY